MRKISAEALRLPLGGGGTPLGVTVGAQQKQPPCSIGKAASPLSLYPHYPAAKLTVKLCDRTVREPKKFMRACPPVKILSPMRTCCT